MPLWRAEKAGKIDGDDQQFKMNRKLGNEQYGNKYKNEDENVSQLWRQMKEERSTEGPFYHL